MEKMSHVAEWVAFEGQLADDGETIKDVLLCGNKSGNGYEIPSSAFGSESNVKSLYDGVKVYLDHVPEEELKKNGRSVRDLAGEITNVRFVDGRPRGDIQIAPTAAGETLRGLSKSKFKRLGCSHVAGYTWESAAKKRVRKVNKVLSVDVVDEPATTNTFHESQKMNEEALMSERDKFRDERDDFRKQADASKLELESLKTKFAESEKALKEAQSKIDEYQTKELMAERNSKVLKALKEAGLDASDKVQVSDVFLKDLMADQDDAIRAERIQERVKLVKSSQGPDAPNQERKKNEPTAFNAAEFVKKNVNRS